MCAFVARTEDVLQAHKSNTHSVRQFACSECHFILNSEIKLQEHKTKKHQTNKYPCDYCGFGAENLAQLDLHIESYHKITKQPEKNNNFNESSRRYSLNERLKNGVCRNFSDGSCRFKDSCKFAHVKLCRFQEKCRSPESCKFYHTNRSNVSFLENRMISYSNLPNSRVFPSARMC